MKLKKCFNIVRKQYELQLFRGFLMIQKCDRFVPTKDIYMLIMLHLNEDLDDDLLKDTI